MSATPADAQVILHLFELRREPEMRKARDWFAGQFHPQSVDDIMNVLAQFGSDGNRYFRMVTHKNSPPCGRVHVTSCGNSSSRADSMTSRRSP